MTSQPRVHDWAQVADVSEGLHQQEKVREVHIDGLAVMKIIRHCDESLPTMVAGSLLGLDIDGVLEVTYAYPFPATKVDNENREQTGTETQPKDEIDGNDYQMEMMKMLREVNMDNNCVGWYQSMYLGTMYTADVVSCQYSYQSAEELSDNTIVIMYDPVQTRKDSLVLKAFRLSDEYIEMRKNKINSYIKSSDILVEIPLKIKNSGHVSAFVRCLHDSHKEELDCVFESLSLKTTDSYVERHLEMIGNWLDDFLDEQKRLHVHSKMISKPRQEQIRWINKRRVENQERLEDGKDELPTHLSFSDLKPLPDGPSKLDHILLLGQLKKYCKQVNQHVDSSIHKLYTTSNIYSK